MFPLLQQQYGCRSVLPFYYTAFSKKNRLFSQYHAQYPEHERNLIVEELVKGPCIHRILFVTIGLGTDCNNIRRVIHIGVPHIHAMEDQLLPGSGPGWERWSSSQGRYLFRLLQYLQIQKKHVWCNEELCAIQTVQKKNDSQLFWPWCPQQSWSCPHVLWLSQSLVQLWRLWVCTSTCSHRSWNSPGATKCCLSSPGSIRWRTEGNYLWCWSQDPNQNGPYSIPSQPAMRTVKEYCRLCGSF